MDVYKTAEIACLIGVHPNTVRLYEKLGLIPIAKRKTNGYRVFTDFHIEQFRLAKMALKVEILQNGLRKQAIEIIKTAAAGDFDRAVNLTKIYLGRVKEEKKNAEEAIAITRELLQGNSPENEHILFTRKEIAGHLQISIDALRNWEMNGLLSVKQKQNGYRIYKNEELKRLKIIRSLRCANYSLTAILRMLTALSNDPKADIREVINTPDTSDDIISVCDKLLTSLHDAEKNAKKILLQLKQMKNQFTTNATL